MSTTDVQDVINALTKKNPKSKSGVLFEKQKNETYDDLKKRIDSQLKPFSEETISKLNIKHIDATEEVFIGLK